MSKQGEGQETILTAVTSRSEFGEWPEAGASPMMLTDQTYFVLVSASNLTVNLPLESRS